MAKKDSNISTMNKNKETIKKVSSKVHEELLNTSHLFIDETVATLTRMQRITGKVIKKSEPILEKQIEITFDAVEALANQAGKGGKRALKLFGVTKQYNKLSATISKKVNAIPSTEEMIDNAKEMVASAKSDVEETINYATDSIKKVTSIGDSAKVEVKKVSAAKAPKTSAKKTTKKAVKKVVKTATAKSTTAKTVSPKTKVKKAVAKTKTAKTTTAKASSPKKVKVASTTTKAKVAAKKVNKVAPIAKVKKTAVAKKVSTTVKKAAKPVASELTQIKGIGASVAAIMTDNGIKTIKDLQNATPTALKIIATKAGNRYKSFDTSKWISAAKAIAK